MNYKYIYSLILIALPFLAIGQRKKNINFEEIKSRLELINAIDQQWQMKLIDYEQSENYDPKSDATKLLYDSFAIINANNKTYVDSILKNYGWLGEDKISRIGQNALFLVVQHSSFDYQLSIKKITKRAYRKGNILSANYALMRDRILVLQNKKQIYGSQAKKYDDKYYIMPCKNKKRLNKRRKKVGLDPIEDYIKSLETTFGNKIYGIK